MKSIAKYLGDAFYDRLDGKLIENVGDNLSWPLFEKIGKHIYDFLDSSISETNQAIYDLIEKDLK